MDNFRIYFPTHDTVKESKGGRNVRTPPSIFTFPALVSFSSSTYHIGVFDKSRGSSGFLHDLTDIDVALSDAYRQGVLSVFDGNGGLDRVFLRKRCGIA